MSFAPWFAINHAFARRLDRPTDQRPLSAQAIAFAATANAIVALVVVCRKEGRKEGRKEEAIFVGSFGSEMKPETPFNFSAAATAAALLCHFLTNFAEIRMVRQWEKGSGSRPMLLRKVKVTDENGDLYYFLTRVVLSIFHGFWKKK